MNWLIKISVAQQVCSVFLLYQPGNIEYMVNIQALNYLKSFRPLSVGFRLIQVKPGSK